MPIKQIKRYGWIKDLPDPRDKELPKIWPWPKKLPPVVDLRPLCPPIYNQGNLGSCTAHALTGIYEFMEKKQGAAYVPMSRLFLYQNELIIEGTPGQDNGAQIRDGIKVMASTGMCPESEWPYDPDKLGETAPAQCYADAKRHEILQYYRMFRLTQMKSCLASGYPFAFGFTVFPSFESDQTANTGIMTTPTQNDLDSGPIGGHAVMAVGYDDTKQVMIVRNSWGDWGDKGYFYMPQNYINNPNLASDFWYVTREQC